MKLLSIILIACALVGCKNETDDFVYKDSPKVQPKSAKSYSVRNLVADAKVDILWVVDNSGSMNDIQQNIVKNSALFMKDFIQNNIMQWKMGVISTDKKDRPYIGFDANDILDHKTTDPVSKLQKAINSLGIYGDASEYVFYNSLRMMTDPIYKSFFRDDAHLAIIMVTDEKEQSEDRFGSQYGPYSLINSIKRIKGSEKILRFYGAFNFRDLQNCNSNWTDFAGSPFEVVINETSGIHMSACTQDFGRDLAEIGKDILSIVDTPYILLNENPIIKTIKVKFANVELKGGPKSEGGLWYYNEEFNRINFYSMEFIPDSIPDPRITIEFDIDDGYNRDEIE
jgi:hypothetical protein